MLAHAQKQVIIPSARENAGRNSLHKAAEHKSVVVIHVVDHRKIEVHLRDPIRDQHVAHAAKSRERFPARLGQIERFHAIQRFAERPAGGNESRKQVRRRFGHAEFRAGGGQPVEILFADEREQLCALAVSNRLLRQHAGEHADIRNIQHIPLADAAQAPRREDEHLARRVVVHTTDAL